MSDSPWSLRNGLAATAETGLFQRPEKIRYAELGRTDDAIRLSWRIAFRDIGQTMTGKAGRAVMRIVNNRFWRLDPPIGASPAAICESPLLSGPEELVLKVKPLDGIVVGTWDDDNEQGIVCALGVVQQVDGPSAVVEWRRANFILRPTGQGATQWRKRSVFKFADLVADRYRLMDRFEDAFGGRAGTTAPAESAVKRSSSPVGAPLDPKRSAPHSAAAEENARFSAPQCNRVAPNGQVFATPERGLFMGNRTSPPRWLICDLHFQRDLKEPRKYTKLFFLDEAVALAAGHRPCNTCRREQYLAYLAAAGADLAINGAADLDAKLNADRKTASRKMPLASLPDGAFVAVSEDDFWLKWADALHRWTPGGYVDPMALTALRGSEATVLTPEPSLAALRNGYAAVVHPSAR